MKIRLTIKSVEVSGPETREISRETVDVGPARGSYTVEHESESIDLFASGAEETLPPHVLRCRLCSRLIHYRGRASHGFAHERKLGDVRGACVVGGKSYRLRIHLDGDRCDAAGGRYEFRLVRSTTRVRETPPR